MIYLNSSSSPSILLAGVARGGLGKSARGRGAVPPAEHYMLPTAIPNPRACVVIIELPSKNKNEDSAF